ncbi:hypothetical protein BrnapMp013 (mitochondrion) [Brassica napus]|uniref:ORF123 n=5 Tax=Brassica TaxID=3705 RepID=Q6YSK0_BRANA|nr:orf123 [Brassica oleracea]YP_004927734.1 orf123 [Brassica juncea]YP_004927831.1 orf123 [Brassica rapa subsp. oleifera]YP_717112.1 hypothetical protein BrnapMp013 [Brassica napus]AHY20311.1 hypothetical protein [Brassica juncea var. tumida]AEH43407.1 orf123 [Brassica rapa subsp. oleifera]AEH43506.1 orf123 [Brassica oleracea]AEH43633.1 orf123 [Brassica juncea]AIZ06162.1 hypothetical protein [Brassica napus]
MRQLRYNKVVIRYSRCSPNLKKARGYLYSSEASAHISIQDFLAHYWPNHLSTRSNVSRIAQTCFIIGKTSTMEIHATQPKKDDRELAKMGAKYFFERFPPNHWYDSVHRSYFRCVEGTIAAIP